MQQPCMKLKIASAGPLAIRKEWSYWDVIHVVQPSENVALTMDEETQQEMLRDTHRITAEKADQDVIMKMLKQVAAVPIAHLNSQKNSPITVEVADALNILSEVSEVDICVSRGCLSMQEYMINQCC